MGEHESTILKHSHILDFINVMKKHNESWCDCCCRCTVLNGECYLIASEGRCNAWNEIKTKNEAIKELEKLSR